MISGVHMHTVLTHWQTHMGHVYEIKNLGYKRPNSPPLSLPLPHSASLSWLSRNIWYLIKSEWNRERVDNNTFASLFKRRHINKCYKYANVHLANWQMRKSKLIFHGASTQYVCACIMYMFNVVHISFDISETVKWKKKGIKQRIYTNSAVAIAATAAAQSFVIACTASATAVVGVYLAHILHSTTQYANYDFCRTNNSEW